MKRKFSMMLLVASVVCLTACSGDEKEVRPSIPASRNMKVGESFNLGYSTDWTTSNKYAATVNNEGVVTAVRKGTAKIYSRQENLSCAVSVVPSYTLYNEPIVTWGITKNELIARKGTPDQESSKVLTYKTENSVVPMEMYQYENNKLTSSAVAVKTTYTEEMVEHLIQRYVPVELDIENNHAYFVSPTSSGEIEMYVLNQLYNTSYWLVMYAKSSSSTTRSASEQAELFEKMKEELSAIEIMAE